MSKEEKAKLSSGKNNQPEKENIISLPQEEYAALKEEAKKAAEYWERLLRTQAEFENIRKRLQKEQQEFVKFANEGLVADLLMVLDDLERSIQLAQQNKEDFPAFLKGIELVLGHFYEILKKRGLSPIQAEGKPFDAHLHEALVYTETDEVREHTVLEELQRGYLFCDRVIRTAKVRISKQRTENSKQRTEEKEE